MSNGLISLSNSSRALFKTGILLSHLANSIPQEHELFIQFIKKQSQLAATITKDKTLYWALDLSLMLDGFVASKIFFGKNGLKNRFERTEEEKQIIRTINAYKRSLKFELAKVCRAANK
jgi:hypothetical protein